MKNYTLIIAIALYAVAMGYSHLNYLDNQRRLDLVFNRVNQLQIDSYVLQANNGKLTATVEDLQALGLDDVSVNYIIELDMINQPK